MSFYRMWFLWMKNSGCHLVDCHYPECGGANFPADESKDKTIRAQQSKTFEVLIHKLAK